MLCNLTVFISVVAITVVSFLRLSVSYDITKHPCCQEEAANITLAMLIDAFEIYGHDPTDKLDYLMHYQVEMFKIKQAPDQYMINEHIHIATDHLGRFINLHIKEMKVLLIAIDDVIDNMLAMFDNHNAIAAERVATYQGGPVPMEYYLSQEYYCGNNIYLFISELYEDIYEMGRGIPPFCKNKVFTFLEFMHIQNENKYYLKDDPALAFPTDNFLQGLECHENMCIYRFPYRKILQDTRDVVTLPKAVIKCGLIVYKLPPVSAVSCIINSGSFIFDFNIQGIRFRHRDYFLQIPNGAYYYTKQFPTPLVCNHHVCEWTYTNFYGGPFVIPGEPGSGPPPIPPVIEISTTPETTEGVISTTPFMFPSDITTNLGCMFLYPPNYGSIGGVSYLDPLLVHDSRYDCATSSNRGPYWYPSWMGAPPFHPYQQAGVPDVPEAPDMYYPHQLGPESGDLLRGMGPDIQ